MLAAVAVEMILNLHTVLELAALVVVALVVLV
jgi:hypothetical protein